MKLNFNVKKTSKKNFEHLSYASINPYRDWYLIIFVFLVLNIAVAIFCTHFFFKSGTTLIVEPTQIPVSTEDIGFSKLQRTIGIYENRKDSFEKALQTSPDIFDPAL
jgi:hypothetical protein